jgi:hypothetical protein
MSEKEALTSSLLFRQAARVGSPRGILLADRLARGRAAFARQRDALRISHLALRVLAFREPNTARGAQ